MTAMLELAGLSQDPAHWGGVLVTIGLKSGAILVLALALLRALGSASAALRHLALATALATTLALPLLSAVLPSWQVRALPEAGDVPWILLAANAAPAPRPGSAHDQGAAPKDEAAAPTAGVLPGTPPAAAIPAVGPAGPGFPQALGYLWLFGSGLLLLRFGVGWLRLRSLARRAEPLDGEWTRTALRVAGRLGLARPVPLRRCDAEVVPMVWGVLRPVILLPAGCGDWAEDRREVVLLHEMAHVRRRDPLAHLIAQLCKTVYWFNPLVWMTERRLRDERERACDDHVLSAGADAAEYANHLLQIVRSFGLGTSASPALAMARRSQFEGRMLAILDPGLPRTRISRRAAGLVGTLALFAVLPLAALAPAPRPAEAAAGARNDAEAPLPVPTLPEPAPRPARAVAVQDRGPGTEAQRPVQAPAPTRTETGRIVDLIGRDGDRAAFLLSLLGGSPDEALLLDVIRASERIGSGGDRRRVLMAVLARPSLGDAVLAALLGATTGMGDGDQAAVLLEVVDRHGLPAGIVPAFFRAAGAVAADGDRARVLHGALAGAPPAELLLGRVLESAERIGSDGDKVGVLVAVAKAGPLSSALRERYLAAVGTLRSNGSRQAALAALAEHGSGTAAPGTSPSDDTVGGRG